MIRVFKSKLIIDSTDKVELDKLTNDFIAYKNGELPDLFGRDVFYDHPNNLPVILTEEVKHIHLADTDSPWHARVAQFRRISDKHLVYCHGAVNENYYLLLAVLSPNAHKQARNNNIMYKLGLMAEKFRSKY